MALNFPSSPVVGQVYTDPTGNISFQWNGTQWVSTKALPVASEADMNAGTADFIFATPKKLKLGFGILLAQNGYFKFPTWLGGLIIQWGKDTAGSTDTTFNFPTPFLNNCFSIAATATQDNHVVHCQGFPTLTSFHISGYNVGTNGNSSTTFTYIAIGN